MTLSDFKRELVIRNLRWPTSIDGVYVDSEVFDALVFRVSEYLGGSVYANAAVVLASSPAIPVSTVERAGYADNFPQLLGVVTTRETVISENSAGPSIALAPTACYHTYPLFASGALPIGVAIDVANWCFRREPSPDPFRMVAFRMRENVTVGEPSDVHAWLSELQQAGLAALARLGLPVVLESASDPFFGATARMMAASQRNQRLKHEFVVELDGTPIAVGSANRHLDHMTHSFGIGGPGDSLHSGCIGFGLERVALALLFVHGLSVGEWPRRVRDLLSLGTVAG